MDINETKIYTFNFKFEKAAFKIDVSAASKEESVEIVKKMLTTMLSDLQINYPNKK